jgi:hypothetical protein
MAALGRRVRLRPSRVSRIGRPIPGPATPCVVCLETPVTLLEVKSTQPPHEVWTLHVCTGCGHVAHPGNTYDYRALHSIDEMPERARIGTAERQGREFNMARMAAEILARGDLDVLIYGAGRSLDNRHIAKLEGVRSVTISDIMRVRDDDAFIESDQPAPRRFALVVASEVVEHFLDPRAELKHLLSFVEDDGLLICSTNILDGTDLAKQFYAFIPGHTSLYSAHSLGLLARENGYLIDFRLPLVATGYAGLRKRYVLMSRSPEVMAAVAEYFGSHAFAPSEPRQAA